MEMVSREEKEGPFPPASEVVAGSNFSKEALEAQDLSQPPPGPCFMVELFFYVNSVSRVDMADMNAQIDIGVCLNWHDPRMIGFPATESIPQTLWGPLVTLWNLEGEASIEHKDFYVSDSKTGFLSRTTRYIATVSFEINETFSLFPFDMIEIPLKMTNAGAGILADAVTKTYVPGNIKYLVVPSRRPQSPIYQFWTFGGHLTEWRLEGCSLNCDEPTADTKKGVESLQLFFHYSRRPGYYLWKMVLPLCILTLCAFGVFEFAIDDITDRFNFLLTVLLSTFALLFVIGADVPRTADLMSIDRTILLSLTATLAAGLLSIYAFNTLDQNGHNIGGWVIILVTFVGFIFFLLQPYFQSLTHIRKLATRPNFTALPDILGKMGAL